MEYRKLGSSDLEVSVLGFGAWGIGGAPFWSTEGDAASVPHFQRALELDPDFAMAHGYVSAAMGNMGGFSRAERMGGTGIGLPGAQFGIGDRVGVADLAEAQRAPEE